LENLYITKELSVRQIAEILNVSPSCVHKKLIKYKIPRREPNETKRKLFLSKDKLIELYWKRNIASPEIAKLFGVSDSTVRNLMEKYGIPRRDTRFKKGITPWIKGRKLGEEYRKRISEAHVKKRISKEELENLYWKQKLSQSQIAKIFGVTRGAVERWMHYYKIPRRSTSEALKIIFEDQSLREKRAKRLLEFHKKYISKIIKALHSKPNKLEKRVIEIINENNLPFKYVGSGEIIINGRNPDFISIDGSKKVIEIFGNYWHSPLFNPHIDWKRTYKETINFYKEQGYDCLVLWEDEVKESVAVEKIKEFLAG